MTTADLDRIEGTAYNANDLHWLKLDLCRVIRTLLTKLEHYEHPKPTPSHADREREIEHQLYERTCIVSGQNGRM